MRKNIKIVAICLLIALVSRKAGSVATYFFECESYRIYKNLFLGGRPTVKRLLENRDSIPYHFEPESEFGINGLMVRPKFYANSYHPERMVACGNVYKWDGVYDSSLAVVIAGSVWTSLFGETGDLDLFDVMEDSLAFYVSSVPSGSSKRKLGIKIRKSDAKIICVRNDHLN